MLLGSGQRKRTLAEITSGNSATSFESSACTSRQVGHMGCEISVNACGGGGEAVAPKRRSAASSGGGNFRERRIALWTTTGCRRVRSASRLHASTSALARSGERTELHAAAKRRYPLDASSGSPESASHSSRSGRPRRKSAPKTSQEISCTNVHIQQKRRSQYS